MRVDIVKEHVTSWSEDEYPIYGRDRYWILECRGCERVFFGHGNMFSENTDHRIDPSTGEWHEYRPEELTFYPRTLKRRKPVWFIWKFHLENQEISKLLNELYQALDNDLPVLAAMASRIVFDAVSEKLNVDTELSFSEKIEALRSAQHITGREKDFLELLTDAGGAAAHRGWSPSDDELNTILEILEGFIHRALVLPKKVEGMKPNIPSKS